jgi:choline dehydrogenase-like flavoprotein
MAGLLLARKLARQGRRVVVLESGLQTFDSSIHELNEIEDPQGRYTRALTGRYRGLGGSSSRWGGRLIPISESDAAPRDYLSLKGWPFPLGALRAHSAEIEGLFDVSDDSYEPDFLETVFPKGPFPREDRDFSCRWAKLPAFRRSNLATVLKQELQQLKTLDIWLGATVAGFRLDRERGRLAAVEARDFGGRKLVVNADNFVFAAGTIETTRLLLWIDECSGGHAFRRSEALGRYFQEHLKVDVATITRTDSGLTNRLFASHFVRSARRELRLEMTPRAQREDGVGSSFCYVSIESPNNSLTRIKQLVRGIQRREFDARNAVSVAANAGILARSLFWRYSRRQVFMPPDVVFRLQVWAEQLPHASNRIRLARKRDRIGLPMASLEWSPSEREERTFNSAKARLKGFWERTAFDRTCPLAWVGTGSVPYIERAEGCAHPSGSARMGTDPRESVVNTDLRCHDVANVFVASAATFPTAGSANPTLTIMQLALRLGDHLLLLPAVV